MEPDEFKRQFQVNRQEAQQRLDELSKKADHFLERVEPLFELFSVSGADRKAGKIEASVKRLKEQGFDSESMLVKELRKLFDDSEDIFMHIEKLREDLNRQTEPCPACNGRGHLEGKPEWVEGDIGRIQRRKLEDCPLCQGRGKFTVDELLHC